MKLDLNDLRLVAAIASGGSLHAAAKALKLNHATVFRRLEALEALLGVRLFERQAGVYRSTAAGEELAQVGASVAQQADDVWRKIQGQDLRLVGEVRLATTDSLAETLLMPALQACRAAHPGIQLQLVTALQHFNLSRREADLALRPTNQVPPHLIGRNLGPLAFAVYGSQAYLQQSGGVPFDWASHAWIALDDTVGQHPSLLWLAQYLPLAQVGLRCNSLKSVQHACVQGMGLALLPCFLGDSERTLQRCSALLPECASQLWLLRHPDLRNTARVTAVADILQAHLQQHAALLAGAGG
ncbi:MAG: hypothetical protein RL748_3095 [Pseudomonadota bacterium]|jgi:molybdate transport repressor ModE-like protein